MLLQARMLQTEKRRPSAACALFFCALRLLASYLFPRLFR